MDTIPVLPLLHGMESDFSFSLKDVKSLRSLNQSFRADIDTSEYICRSFQFQFPDFYKILEEHSRKKNTNISEVLRRCDIRLLELERILQNLIKVNNRRRRQKYGYLLVQHLFRFRTTTEDKTSTQNTLIILSALHEFTELLAENQPYVFTNLPLYPQFWLSDYVKLVYHIRQKSLDSPPVSVSAKDWNFKCNWNHCDFFQMIQDMTIIHEDIASSLVATSFEEFVCGMTVMLMQFNAFLSDSRLQKNNYLYYTMSYIRNSFKMSELVDIVHKQGQPLMNMICIKCIEFANHQTDDHDQQNVISKIKIVCSELSAYI